jgi:hypothetical protein
MSDTPTDAEILKSLGLYTRDRIQIHTMLRDAFLEKDIAMGVMKHQGSIDTCQDIARIIEGGKVATLAEIREEIKKQEDSKQGSYLG